MTSRWAGLMNLDAGDTAGLERLGQYLLRCPFSLQRLIKVTDQGQVLYLAQKRACRRFPRPASPDLFGGVARNFQVFDVFDFGGFGTEYASISAPQDCSLADGFSFWFHGTGSGLTYQAEISDNRSDPNTDTSERFDYEFTDTTPGWQRLFIPWSDFSRATDFQPPGAPDDGFTLTEIWAWAIVLPQGADTVYFDDVGLGYQVVVKANGLAAGKGAIVCDNTDEALKAIEDIMVKKVFGKSGDA